MTKACGKPRLLKRQAGFSAAEAVLLCCVLGAICVIVGRYLAQGSATAASRVDREIATGSPTGGGGGRPPLEWQIPVGQIQQAGNIQTAGEIRQAGKFSIFDNAVRDPQSAHIGVLVRRDIEQAEIAPAEIIGWLWIFTPNRMLLQPLVSVERMLLPFKSLLIGESATSC